MMGADGWDWEIMSFWEFNVDDNAAVPWDLTLATALLIVEGDIGWMTMGGWLEDLPRLFIAASLVEMVIFLVVVVAELGLTMEKVLLFVEFWDDNEDVDEEALNIPVGLNFFAGEEISSFITVFKLRFTGVFTELSVTAALSGNVTGSWVAGISLISYVPTSKPRAPANFSSSTYNEESGLIQNYNNYKNFRQEISNTVTVILLWMQFKTSL